MSGLGILMPALAYRFRVIPRINQNDSMPFIQNMISVDIDLFKKELLFKIREDILGGTSSAIRQIGNGTAYNIDYLDGSIDGKPITTLIFPNTKTISHNMRFDYASKDVVTHELLVTFVDFNIINHEKE